MLLLIDTENETVREIIPPITFDSQELAPDNEWLDVFTDLEHLRMEYGAPGKRYTEQKT